MRIMPGNLQRQFELHQAEYEQKALDVLRSGWYVLGKEVSAFEEEFAAYIGAAHCVGLANGLDALWIAFKLLGVGPGDEVIVCANAYIACVMGITIPGGTPVFVEPDEYDNIDASKIEAAITGKTRAILAVHLYGQACDMASIMDIARRNKLLVVEDCAQSHGSHFQGQTVGTFGDVACYSFYPTKGCGAFGDGGAIVTNNQELAGKTRVFRNYGSSRQYQFDLVGTNSRLDEMQAGLLRVRLAHLNELNEERQRLSERYLSEITNPHVRLPRLRPGADCVWHQFVLHTTRRDELQAWLREKEVGSLIHYPIPPHLSSAYEYLGHKKGAFPVAEQYANEVLSLPLYNGMTKEEQDYTIEVLNAFT